MSDKDIKDWEYCFVYDVEQHPVTGDWLWHNPARDVLEEVQCACFLRVRDEVVKNIFNCLPYGRTYFYPPSNRVGLLHTGI